MNEPDVKEIVKQVTENFRCFGGDNCCDTGNPIDAAMANQPPQFALGVDVESVVQFVLDQSRKPAKRKKVPLR